MKKSKKLKIAIFEPSRYLPGGGPKNMANIASYLSEKHDITVFTQNVLQEGINFKDCNIKYLYPKNKNLQPFAFRNAKLNDDFDLVIYGAFPALLAYENNKNIPSINISHAPPRAFYDADFFKYKLGILGVIKNLIKIYFFKDIEREMGKRVDKILVVSEEIKKRVKAENSVRAYFTL
ncbi:MAG: glycosyltransferase, partial [Nanoarchaeota archaeon]